MKIIICLTVLVAMTLAEPPSYRQQFQPDRTYYFAKQQEVETAQGDNAPYQPSGWKPDGPAFELPQKQEKPEVPANQYGAPPQQEYGAPSNLPEVHGTTTPPPTGTESQAEPVDSVNELEEEGDADEQQRQTGEYYIALPDGRLQRVQYMSSQDAAAMKYFAKIQAENIEPLRGAIYAYQPLRKLEFAPARLEVAVNEPIGLSPIVQVREELTANNQRIRTNNAQAQPLAAQLSSPVSSSYTSNYQVPEQRYFITF